MKKLLYLGFAAALTMGFGCAITNYDLITSNNDGVVNTNGKALIQQSAQVATTWSDGTDVAVWYVDQTASGDRTLTTYNLLTPAGSPNSPFQDYSYCNPGWTGCAMVTADDPQVGDVDIFDYRLNANCDGLRSLSYLLSTSRYYGECGRTVRPSLSQRFEMFLSGKPTTMFGQNGMLYNVGPNSLSITLTNENNETYALPINGHTSIWLKLGGSQYNALINATNPILATTIRAYGDFLATHATYGKTVASVSYNGATWSLDVAGNRGGEISSPAAAAGLAARM